MSQQKRCAWCNKRFTLSTRGKQESVKYCSTNCRVNAFRQEQRAMRDAAHREALHNATIRKLIHDALEATKQLWPMLSGEERDTAKEAATTLRQTLSPISKNH